MRVIGKAAILMAITTLSAVAPIAASAQETGGHRVAVVDVAHIFKNHPAIKAQVERVENDLKAYDGELQKKREDLKLAVEQLKTLKVGSADYSAREEQVAAMESKLRLDMARKRKELADAEARIYFENYQGISSAVKALAEHNKIDLVIRYNSEDMDIEKGDSVIRGVMKNIVYHGASLDMTPVVMQYLDKFMTTNTASNPGAAAKR